MAEVQQSSDATFRLFDWNRMGTDGKPRTLHIEESLRAINFAAGPIDPVPDKDPLVRCPYFQLRRGLLLDPANWPVPGGECSIFMVIHGSCDLVGKGYGRTFRSGETVLIPANAFPSPLVWHASNIWKESKLLEITLPA